MQYHIVIAITCLELAAGLFKGLGNVPVVPPLFSVWPLLSLPMSPVLPNIKCLTCLAVQSDHTACPTAPHTHHKAQQVKRWTEPRNEPTTPSPPLV